MTRALRAALPRLALVLASTALALAAGEFALRLLYPGHVFLRGATRDTWDPRNPAQRLFVSHPQLGFIPILGGEHYDAWGARRNAYAFDKPPGTQRLLFIGDSVTSRGRIVQALRELVGDDGVEYWNAGVEGYNTFQEVEFYKRWNAHLLPDHVILTFHNNDFDITPVTFVDADGRLVVYQLRAPLPSYDPSLFGMSSIYRLLLARLAAGSTEVDRRAIVRDSLVELRQLVESRGARLSVVLFPLLQPLENWNPSAQKSRALSLGILKELGIPTFDLLPALQEMITQGVPLPEVSGDIWHPSTEAAAGFAAWLYAAGLLEPQSAGR